MSVPALSASFRDPSGFLFEGADGCLYRQINHQYQQNFEMLHSTGLYSELADRGLLINHDIVENVEPASDEAFCVIRPQRIPFVSYPYEWAFSALKDAAILTLDVQLRALNHDMQLKDASAYNVQFEGCRPIFIDTLSFERLERDKPWKAYGQFCRHFLAPLALMSKTHLDAGFLLRNYIDGIPLDVASRMLPLRTRLSLGLQLHIHWHGKMIARHHALPATHGTSDASPATRQRKMHMPTNRLKLYLENLGRTIDALRVGTAQTEWADYYEDNSYSSAAFQQKQNLVDRFLRLLKPKTVWDLGANTGVFSRVASDIGCYTCAFDIDPACVERAYVKGRLEKQGNLLPLRMDLTNPSPSLGWAHSERESLLERGPADLVMALALIHHLAISNNVPLEAISRFFSRLGKSLIIEFVPKGDPQVKRLLSNRDDIFDGYHQSGFERAFEKYFHVRGVEPIGPDGRTLYLMQTK